MGKVGRAGCDWLAGGVGGGVVLAQSTSGGGQDPDIHLGRGA